MQQKHSKTKADLEAFVCCLVFFFLRLLESWEKLDIRKPFKMKLVWVTVLLYLAWGTVKDRSSKSLRFSGGLPGVNWQTSTDQVDKGTEFLLEMESSEIYWKWKSLQKWEVSKTARWYKLQYFTPG